MAPEYALYGQLTEKADVFSFGVVAMEIVSGKSNMKQTESSDPIWLINWVTLELFALTLQQTGDIMDIIDPVLEGEFNSKEAEVMIKVGLACTNSSPLSRPTMSEAVQMLEGETEITQVLSDPGLYGSDWNISKMRSTDTHGSSSTSGLTDQTATTMKSFVSGADLYPLYPDSMILNSTTFLPRHSSIKSCVCIAMYLMRDKRLRDINFPTPRFLSLSICEHKTLEEESSPVKKQPEPKPIIGVKRSLSDFQEAQDHDQWSRKLEDMINFPKPQNQFYTCLIWKIQGSHQTNVKNGNQAAF
ncbi:LOW QUALITY PROTEIN: hypothetical protein YC2023_024726 [Brassica napus]